MGRGMLRLQCERPAVACHRLLDPPQFEQYGPRVAVTFGAAGVELNGLGIVGQGLTMLTEIAQHVPQIIVRIHIAGIELHGLP